MISPWPCALHIVFSFTTSESDEVSHVWVAVTAPFNKGTPTHLVNKVAPADTNHASPSPSSDSDKLSQGPLAAFAGMPSAISARVTPELPGRAWQVFGLSPHAEPHANKPV